MANSKSAGKAASTVQATSDSSGAVSSKPLPSDNPSSAVTGSGKPDKAAYDAEQNRLKSEIDAVQVKFNAIKDKINTSSKDGPGSERRKELRAELDGLRDQQASGKSSRSKTLEQLKAIQEATSKKTKDLQAAKAKHPYKSIAEIDSHVKSLETQIDSGNMKLADEKRALQEISQAKRARKVVENFQKDQQTIDDDRAQADELRKQLDDPKAKAASERYEAIKVELDEIKKEGDEVFANRNKLYDERNALKTQLDALYSEKKEGSQAYKEANDRHWNKLNEDRAKRAEKYRLQKAAEEDEKRAATAERLREEASAPAFQSNIEDCQTLIDYFSAKVAGGQLTDIPAPSLSSNKTELAGVPKLDIRVVDAEPTAGLVARKKKGEDDDNYFVGGKGKKKGGRSAPGSGPQTPASGSQLNLPLGILTALLEMSIPTPGSTTEVPRVINDIKTKKAWYEANQERVTSENIAKAEKDIQRLTHGASTKTEGDVAAPANGSSKNTSEPSPTPPKPEITETSAALEETVSS